MSTKKYVTQSILLLLFICFIAITGIGQTKYINLIRAVSNDDDVKKVYDSLHVPLMVFRNAVYSVNTDCISESFGQSERSSGGGSSSGGGRKSGGGSDASEVSSKGGRKSGGSSYGFYCEVDSKGKLILYIDGMQKNEVIRIFYNDSFIDSKYYKIKQ